MTIILFNNKFLNKKTAKISVLSDSFARGYGVFETLRTFHKKPFQTKEHLNRLSTSAKKIDLKPKYSKHEILQQLQKVTQKSPHQNQRLRITVVQEGIIITSEKLQIHQKIYRGVSCMTTPITRSLPEIKSISYIPSFISHRKAVKKGYYEGILTDKNGKVYEGAYSNLFWFEGDTLCTRKEDVLQGITRQTILEISPFFRKFKKITVKELSKKKEIFLTSSIVGVVPVIKINNKKIGNGEPGPKTKKLMELYNRGLQSNHLQS